MDSGIRDMFHFLFLFSLFYLGTCLSVDRERQLPEVNVCVLCHRDSCNPLWDGPCQSIDMKIYLLLRPYIIV